MGWYGDWAAGWRMALALAAAVVVIGALWWVSVTAASKYEARTSTAWAELNTVWPLTQPGFWKGQALVGRQRKLYVAAACASVALIAALPPDRPAAARCAAFQARAAGGPSAVAAAYAAATAGAAGSTGDDRGYARHRGMIAKAWAVALVTDHAPVATALAVGGAIVVVLAAELAAAVAVGPARHPALLADWWHGLATLTALVGILVADWLVTLPRLAYSNTADRKTVGALWDVAILWPRAVHPLAPPCYAVRAVPEVVDRIRLLTGNPGSKPDDEANFHAQAGRPDLPRTRGLTVPPGPCC